MRQPEIYGAAEIKHWDSSTEIEPDYWVPARPMGHNVLSWTRRWKLAWGVLIGKYDALRWDGDQ